QGATSDCLTWRFRSAGARPWYAAENRLAEAACLMAAGFGDPLDYPADVSIARRLTIQGEVGLRNHADAVRLGVHHRNPADLCLDHDLLHGCDIILWVTTLRVGCHDVPDRRIRTLAFGDAAAGNIAVGHHPHDTLRLPLHNRDATTVMIPHHLCCLAHGAARCTARGVRCH